MNTVISIRIDQDVKAAAQEVVESMGLKLGTVVTAYLKQLAATRRLELYAPEPMTPHLEEMITKVEQELDQGMISQPFTSADSFLSYLKK